ncbi:hypothetical protein [Algibacillus agarilyticus]|uniref:hypothetical protein n=1 Tax=Algibacillus agarilyticus TaxID=2234133 RepID=UPI000DD07765|nr:hypothetical protein [Algibacillus agarilyticus]
MLHQIESWIDQTNIDYQDKKISCSKFFDEFKGFYSLEFLQKSYFVITDEIPKPNFPELREMGLGDFIDMEVSAITYKNTYYVLPQWASDLRLHFHELVHVAQWAHLGAIPFIERYIIEIQTSGYNEAPLEKMAYGFDSHFMNGGEKVDVPNYVVQKI